IKMPEMDGLEVLRRVKRADPTIEVVMITAYASLETVKLALTHGAFEYLIKPFSRQDLEDVVRRALVRRQADLGARGEVATLVADNRASGRPVDPCERELLEMLSEYLAIALRNSHLYGEIADTKRSLEQLIASAGDAIISVDAGDRIDGWNPAAERVFGRAAAE